jgi:GNAT superfamily N-acetyltransferase
MIHAEPTPATEELLTRAMFPDPVRIARALAAYRVEANRHIFAWQAGGRMVSAAGLRVEEDAAEVLHIGTRPDMEGQGYGRALLHAVLIRLQLNRMTAETDDDAVDFYRRSGFGVVETQDRGGRRRYLCTLTPGKADQPCC